MGANHSVANVKKPVVLVVGGGSAGVAIVNQLLKNFGDDVFTVLLERKDYFYHNIAALRAAVQPGYEEQVIIPYTNLFPKPSQGVFIQAEVEEITATSVRVKGRQEPVNFDYLVIASGTSYAFPGKVSSVSNTTARQQLQNIQQLIGNSRRVAIAGAGPVGIELAGELNHVYKDLEITLISSGESVLSDDFRVEFRNRLITQLQARNVKLLFNQRVDFSAIQYRDDSSNHQHLNNLNYITGPVSVPMESGTVLPDVDLLFVATGGHVNNKSLLKHFQAQLNEEGRLKCNEYLQVQGFNNIFALGDIAGVGPKMAAYIQWQAPVIAKTIHAIVTKKEKFPAKYKPVPHRMMVVPIGPNGGAGQLPTKKGMIIGTTLTPMLKGKNLFTEGSWAALHQEKKYKKLVKKAANPWETAGATPSADQISTRKSSMMVNLQLDDSQANTFLAGYPTLDQDVNDVYV